MKQKVDIIDFFITIIKPQLNYGGNITFLHNFFTPHGKTPIKAFLYKTTKGDLE